jgi:hypothetical protein
VGRLDNILARNRRSHRRINERLIVSMAMGLIVLLILALMVFTDLGLPPVAPDAGTPNRETFQPPPPRPELGHRVDGILLRAPARSAPTPSPAPPSPSPSH